MTRPIGQPGVSLPVVEADVRLQDLLTHPPAGHRPEPQPDSWYEAVFDALACAHPETCTCTPKETS